MIIELHLKIDTHRTLIGAWEFPKKIWEERYTHVLNFVPNTIKSQNSQFVTNKDANRIVYQIKDKPYKFYLIQQGINEYFRTINGIVLVS